MTTRRVKESHSAMETCFAEGLPSFLIHLACLLCEPVAAAQGGEGGGWLTEKGSERETAHVARAPLENVRLAWAGV